jgi:hypothetical protein
MIPPARTAATTAADVQLAAVPRPTTWLGCDVSTGRAEAGTGTERAPGAEPRELERAVGAREAATIRQQTQAIRSGRTPGA